MIRVAVSLSALVVGSLAVAAARTPQASAVTPAQPTFSKDVAPILFEHCTQCHRPGEIAPMSLLTYQDARPWARAIQRNVVRRSMPLWHADPAFGTWLNDRRLTQAEIDTIVHWVDAGAPQGDPRDLPHRPQYIDGWNIGRPDAVVSMEQDFSIPARGEVRYQYFEVPTHFTQDRWVQALEVRPGNRAVVHHVLIYARSPGATERTLPFQSRNPPRSVSDADRSPAARGGLLQQLGARLREETARGALIAQIAPGSTPMAFAPDTALLLQAGTVLTFQIHYTTNGKPATDRTSIGFRFASKPPQHPLYVAAMQNERFVIPPGAPNYPVEPRIEFVEDVTIYRILPHTHLRGKSWEYTLTYPGTAQFIVLSVPQYDFNWQTDYEFAMPLHAPKGSVLKAVAVYDNSRANKANPDPTQPVYRGDQIWEEMQYTGLVYSIDRETRTRTAPRR
jgi:mono/diheme cytochrome c family protein